MCCGCVPLNHSGVGTDRRTINKKNGGKERSSHNMHQGFKKRLLFPLTDAYLCNDNISTMHPFFNAKVHFHT